ncbi:hypothetical protein Gorai_018296, partial [Gossypium raimondii]|nr:hypothetical protein [Gossypium raimondii]
MFSSYVPRWLQVLLTEKFFNACIIHEDARKNEKNIYCLDCCISICPRCLAPHSSHRLLQVRRYVYHDVIRLDDATKLMDCAFVQVSHHPLLLNSTSIPTNIENKTCFTFNAVLTVFLCSVFVLLFHKSYITNSAKVVFINQRPQTRQFRGSGNFCTICDRSLQDPYLFC